MASRRIAKTWGSLLGVFVTLCSSAASADERAVLKRLKNYGELSAAEAQAVVEKISERMRVAADISRSDDPVRLAVGHALYDAAEAADPSATSMVRLRLYAGLTEWALDEVFSSRRAVTKVCTESGVSATDCRALLAAGQSVPLDEISPLRVPARASRAEPEAPSDRAIAANTAVQSAREPRASTAMRPSQSGRVTSSSSRSAPSRAGSQMVGKPNSQEVAQRKADYAAQRSAYLERRRQEMEARRAKIIATAGGGERVQRGPATQAEAEAAGLAGSAREKGAQPALVASSSTASAPARAERENSAEPDLFDSLLENPLGK